MAQTKLSAVILAAGVGKRLKLDVPKPLASLAGKRIIDFPLMAIRDFSQKINQEIPITLVIGHRGDEIKNYVLKHYDFNNIYFVTQEKQLGTADALKCYFQKSKKQIDAEHTLVLCGDAPLIRSQQIFELYSEYSKESTTKGILASFHSSNPYGYGRIVRTGPQLFQVVEEKDLSLEQKRLSEVNSSLYFFESSQVQKKLETVSNHNSAKEFYLTQIFDGGKSYKAHLFESETPFLGVNDLEQLERAENLIFQEKMSSLKGQGVRFIDSKTNYIDHDVEVGDQTLIYPCVVLKGKTQIGKSCLVENGCVIKDSVIKDGTCIYAYSYLDEADIDSDSSIGPFARLRPQTVIGSGSKIGNFVEIKKSKLEKEVKVSHLSYVGDATIGEGTNIGCGFITCNYDGLNKQKTIIGKDCFIGSDSQMIAPVKVGDRSYVASGSTINKDVPEGAFAIARSRQENKENMAKRFLKGKKDHLCVE